jgi:hypothetical protein
MRGYKGVPTLTTLPFPSPRHIPGTRSDEGVSLYYDCPGGEASR